MESRESPRESPGRDGPWGELVRAALVTEKPEDYIDINEPMRAATAWRLAAADPATAKERLAAAGVPGPVLEALFREASMEGGSTVLRPDDAFITALSPADRSALYRELRRAEAASFIVFPFCFPAGSFRERMKGRVDEETISIVEPLLYRVGKADCFSDVGPALRAVRDTAERRRLLKALTRQNTMLLKLVVRSETDVDSLLGYWSTPGRRKDLQPLLQSLKEVPGGMAIDVVHLLPAFARQRLYTYPETVVSGPRDYDCHWTSLNFFRREPDMDLLDSAKVASVLANDYEVVPGPTRLGDVILFTVDGSTVVHSCVYIADNVVFTKNGANPLQPWLFMTLEEMEVVYPTENPYRMITYRLKASM